MLVWLKFLLKYLCKAGSVSGIVEYPESATAIGKGAQGAKGHGSMIPGVQPALYYRAGQLG
jgi:hypothetical protein